MGRDDIQESLYDSLGYSETKKNKGYQIYQKIFNNSAHQHLKSSLESVHYLKAYQKLVNDARSGDLVLNFKPLKLAELQEMVRETKVLHQCSLLQDLGIVASSSPGKTKSEVTTQTTPPLIDVEVKEFLLNLVKHHHLLGQETLIKQAKTQF